ncbi:acyl carrier protein [Kitasatospora sp. NPDC048540]|uniref:acyl carrier protein n=1 Tax=unclassified Kitasatospora TaxID=2633591 RepID=UPI000539BECF|nr:acyl carrier protein [Kitasatospora sp. MBT63]
MAPIKAVEAQNWLIEKIAHRLGVEPSEVSPEQYFDELELDSTEALILAGEMENWLGFELGTTALWYHPSIKELAAHIAEESATRTEAGHAASA